LFTFLHQGKKVNGFGQSPIEKITKRLFEAQLTTLITLKAQYQITNILAAIIINITIVFIVLKITSRL